jgi:predicted acyltransferase
MHEQSTGPMPVPTPSARRALGLDALRGIAILLMVLSGIVPMHLPAWMYHAQLPPPSHEFDPNIPGLTWVDLVFPFFLFALGAAIPLALSRRLERGTPKWKIVLGILQRGALLAFFAVYRNHFVNPWAISSEPSAGAYIICIIAFALLFLMYWRYPRQWPPWLGWTLRIAGWGAAIILMATITFSHGSHADPRKSYDIIIMILANVAVSGGIIWLITAHVPLARLAVLACLFALQLSAETQSWAKAVWNWTPSIPWPSLEGGFSLSWLYQFGWQQYLHIVLPGTIAGDLLVKWINASGGKSASPSESAWSRGRLIGLIAFGVAINLIVCTGLQARWVGATTIIAFAMMAAGMIWLVATPRCDTERLLRSLFLWGVAWLILGLFFEPYQGGIKKDWATMSYFYVTGGLAIFLMISLMIAIDMPERVGRIPLPRLLIDNGQNPMIAYVAHGMLIVPLLLLIPFPAFWTEEFWMPALNVLREIDKLGQWIGFLRACLETLLLAVIVMVFTRRKIFWRS